MSDNRALPKTKIAYNGKEKREHWVSGYFKTIM